MNAIDRLTEELKMEYWVIDTYDDFNRVKILFGYLSLLGIRGIESKLRFPSIKDRFIQRDYGISTAYIKRPGYKDITQLFNEYLEGYEPKVWMHSVLSAIQLGLKVEHKGSDGWFETNTLLGIGARLDIKYRIDHKKTESIKLVPDEVWDILDDDITFISKNENGDIYAYKEKPIAAKKEFGEWFNGGICFEITYLKIMNNAKIHNVDWKESLCIRPQKD